MNEYSKMNIKTLFLSQDKVSTNVGFLTLLATVLAFMINIIFGITLGWETTKYLREIATSIRIACIPFIWIRNNDDLQDQASAMFRKVKCIFFCKCG